MSLIDPAHLIGPFKNTVHMIAIIFVVLLFAVYRLATGGVEVQDISKAPATQQLPQAGLPVLPLAGAKPAQGSNTATDLGMVGVPKGSPAQGDGSTSSLSDIEKALGMAK